LLQRKLRPHTETRDAAERAFRELQATQASPLHAQKLASLGQLTAGIFSIELLEELGTASSPIIDTLADEWRGEIDEALGTVSQAS
jgi:hypothetical protein